MKKLRPFKEYNFDDYQKLQKVITTLSDYANNNPGEKRRVNLFANDVVRTIINTDNVIAIVKNKNGRISCVEFDLISDGTPKMLHNDNEGIYINIE